MIGFLSSLWLERGRTKPFRGRNNNGVFWEVSLKMKYSAMFVGFFGCLEPWNPWNKISLSDGRLDEAEPYETDGFGRVWPFFSIFFAFSTVKWQSIESSIYGSDGAISVTFPARGALHLTAGARPGKCWRFRSWRGKQENAERMTGTFVFAFAGKRKVDTFSWEEK